MCAFNDVWYLAAHFCFLLCIGLSPCSLLVAGHRIQSYEDYFETYDGSFISDPEFDGLELLSIMPLSKVKLQCVCKFELLLHTTGRPSLYFELCNTRLTMKSQNEVWNEWTKLVECIKDGIITPCVPMINEERVPIHTLCTPGDSITVSYRMDGQGQGLRQLQQLVQSYNNTYHPQNSSLDILTDPNWNGSTIRVKEGIQDSHTECNGREDMIPLHDTIQIDSVVTDDLNRNNAAAFTYHQSVSQVKGSQSVSGCGNVIVQSDLIGRHPSTSSRTSRRIFTRSSGIIVQANGHEDITLNMENRHRNMRRNSENIQANIPSNMHIQKLSKKYRKPRRGMRNLRDLCDVLMIWMWSSLLAFMFTFLFFIFCYLLISRAELLSG